MVNLSGYPDAIDGYGNLPLVRDGISEIRADDINVLRDAIIKIEMELGIQPSSVFATVRARLDDIGDSSATISSHIANTVDAHDASAISILDTAENYTSAEVEGALGELAAVLPVSLDVIGANNTSIPNSGLSSFVSKLGTLHVFNTAASGTDLTNTQPRNITGIRIIEVGADNDTAASGGILTWLVSGTTLAWTAPGDSIGTAVNISTDADFVAGTGAIILASSDTTKKIRIARDTVASLPGTNQTDTFGIMRLDAAAGTFSYTGSGFEDSNYITRMSDSYGGTSIDQFMISGMVFPADKGTLVVQKKLRGSSDTFTPIATLDLTAQFTEANRDTGQVIYNPTLTNFDTITLFDRHPERNNYETLDLNADGNNIYDNFDITTTTFSPNQVARYLIPMANSDIVTKGAIEAITDITANEIDTKVAAYRIIHYKAGVTDFSGDPAAADILSVFDSSLANTSDGNAQFTDLFLDSSTSRPSLKQVVFRPVADVESVTKIISGIHYYNKVAGSSDEFDLEIESNDDVFDNAYKRNGILTLASDSVSFAGAETDAYGEAVSVDRLLDDGYMVYSDTNLPDFTTAGKDSFFYLINASNSTANRLEVDGYKFSTNASVVAYVSDPFAAGNSMEGFGLINTTYVRVLVNSYGNSATDTVEKFQDENYRDGYGEEFTFELDAGQFTGAGSNGTLTAWDNTAALNDGELQVGGRFSTDITVPGLIFPQDDYNPATASTPLRPTQQAADYDSFIWDCEYQRLFSLGIPTNGGKLIIKSGGSSLVSFDDIKESNPNRPIMIQVKVPGSSSNSTGWLDIGKPYETNMVSDGDGALTGEVIESAGNIVVPFTTGTVNNSDTGNMIAVRVTYFYLVDGQESKNKILTHLELIK